MLSKLEPKSKTGDERLQYNCQSLQFTLLDFWRWSASDIMSNATRGLFAEFIVASVVGINKVAIRDEWSAYDLQTADGIKIEVKSSAYLQSWDQKKVSSVRFGIPETREWDYGVGKYAEVCKRQADVYVFCLLHHQDKLTVNPLNLNQWKFYVVATGNLNLSLAGAKSISLKALQKITPGVAYDSLNYEIIDKHKWSSPSEGIRSPAS